MSKVIRFSTVKIRENWNEIIVRPEVTSYEWADDGDQIDVTIEIVQTNGVYQKADVVLLESADEIDSLVAALKEAKKVLPDLVKKAEAKIAKDRKARLRREAAKSKAANGN